MPSLYRNQYGRPHDRPTLFIAAFADYVHEQREAISRQWMPLVRHSPDVLGAQHISAEALQDHVPELMDDLVERLRLDVTKGESGREATASHSRRHGRDQWKAGYNVSELIWEIYIIRRVLTQSVLREFAQGRSEYSKEDYAQAEALILDFFQRLTCDSVGQFIEEQQRVIQKKHRALEEANASRERLTRTVSHELRNVLGALTLATTLLGEDGTSEAERRDMGQVCARMLADMTRILNNLLDFSALVAGRAQAVLEPVFLPELFAEVAAQWRPVAEAQGMAFEGHCDPALGETVSDRLKLKQIAGNLLSNAVKYRRPGEAGRVRLAFLTGENAGWRLTVADAGLGIAAEDVAGLFGEFHRVRPSGAVEGTGLGLAICKEFAELLGGRIAVSAESPQGTRFEVALPWVESDQAA